MMMRLSQQREHSSPVMPAVGRGRFAMHSHVRPVLNSPGQQLDGETRQLMSNRLGHDFSRVRIHRGSAASHSSRALGTRAYAVGSHVVLDEESVSPGTAAGKALLAHELTHVVQQGGHSPDTTAATGFTTIASGGGAEHEARQAQAGGVVSPAQQMSGPVLQREEPDDKKKKPKTDAPQADTSQQGYQLQWPGLQRPSILGQGLELDPELSLWVSQMLARQRIHTGLLKLDFDTMQHLFPASSLDNLPQVPSQEKKPLVPAGKGPKTPRPGKPGDVLKAVIKIPSVDAAIIRLKDQALSKVKRDWRHLSTGGKVGVVSSLVLVGGGALAGLMSHESSRIATLDLIKGWDMPIPGVPGLTMKLDLVGPDMSVQFGLNVGQFLPKSLGFQ